MIDDVQAERVTEQFCHIVSYFCHNDLEQTVRNIEVVSAQDKRSLRHWNTKELESKQTFAYQEIMEIAKQQPGRPAVYSWGYEYTYGQLVWLLGRLAVHLIKNLGIQISRRYWDLPVSS